MKKISKAADKFLEAFDIACNEYDTNLSLNEYAASVGWPMSFTIQVRTYLENRGVL